MSLAKEISSITECSICTEPFVDPRILPCVHTFCLKCLESCEKSKNYGDIFTCPICRATFELPSKKFSDLPVNFFINKLLEVNKIARGPSESDCDVCSTNSAGAYCFDCRQSVCENCCEVHNKLRYNKAHQVVEFGKKQAEELLKVSPTFCECHPDEVVKYFCTDCEATICMSCYVEEHSSHKCSNILKVSDNFLQRLQEDTTKVSEHIKTCFSEEEKLKRKKAEFIQHVAEKQSQVNKVAEDLHSLVDVYRKVILSEISSIKEAKLKEFQVTGNEIRDTISMMESFRRYSEEVITKATPADVTRLATTLKKRAVELHAMRLDNDLCSYDIEIASPNLKHALAERIESPVGEVAVCNNRKESVKAFSPFGIFLPLPKVDKNPVYGLTTIGQELFIISRNAVSVISSKKLIAKQMMKLPIPASNTYNYQSTYQVINYTKCNSMVFHLQLWYCWSSTTETLQLQISRGSLTESDGGNLDNEVEFDLKTWQLGQPSNLNQTYTLRAPKKLNGGYIFGIQCSCQLSGTSTSLKVRHSLSFNPSNTNYAEEFTLTVPFSTPRSALATSPGLRLEVYDMDSGKSSSTVEDNKFDTMERTIEGAILNVKLPDTFVTEGNSSVNRTSYTQSDSVLIYLQLTHKESSSSRAKDIIELKLSKLSLSESDGNFVPNATFNIQPIRLKQLQGIEHNVTLKATQKLINSGFHGIEFRFQIETSPQTVKVEVSIIGITTAKDDYPVEAKFDVPTEMRTESLRLLRTISLPPTLDPTGMVSCPYYQCIYIGDRQNSSIYRVNPLGKLTKWPVDDVPDGLSVTSYHTLVVTFGKSSNLKEYNTNGVALQDIQLTDLNNPIHSLRISDNRFIVISQEAGVYLASVTESVSQAAAKAIVLPSDEDTILEVPKKAISKIQMFIKAVGKDTSSTEVNEKCEVQLNGPIHATVDRFGFIFFLTEHDAKVHLFSPHLNYVCELIALDKYGMSKPSKIHFHDESGTLYVGSNDGPNTLLGFQVTEGKVDPSNWKKDKDP